MQAYSPGFARVYNRLWGRFALQIAPLIQEFYESTLIGGQNRLLLDLCCGTGQLARYFLERGYQVVGIDLSEAMLRYARENTLEYVLSGHAQFIHADASHFELDHTVGLVVSTFDALNHLDSLSALRSCFKLVYDALLGGGSFIFDLNTRVGLKQHWNSVTIEDSEELTLINRGIYDGEGDRAYTRITGYIRLPDGLYERFEETAYNTVFAMHDVQQALLEVGFRQFYSASAQDLKTPVDDPERLGRVFFIVTK
jgi:SAM-dependent methyltransferase